MVKDPKKPGRKSLRKKIVAAILTVGIVPLLVGVYLTYLGGMRGLIRSTGNSFEAMAKETANKIDIVLRKELDMAWNLTLLPEVINAAEVSNLSNNTKSEEIKSWLNVMSRNRSKADNPYLKGILSNDASVYLKNVCSRSKECHAILVTDAQGLVVAATDTSYGYYQGDKKWWRQSFNNGEGSSFIGNITFEEKKKIIQMEIAVPVFATAPQGKRAIGVVNILYNPDEIFSIIKEVKIGKSGHANLVSESGLIIICPIFPPRSHNIGVKVIRKIKRRVAGWSIVEDDGHGGRDSIIGFAPVNFINHTRSSFANSGWHVFIRQNPSETYAHLYKLLMMVYIIGLSLIGMLVLMGIYASRKLVEPIKLLKKEAELIGKGNLDHRVQIQTGDEIESLAHEFNKMAESLKYSHGQLSKERDKLERILLSAGEGIVVADAENNVIMINPVGEKILGITRAQIEGKSIFPCHKDPDKVAHFIKHQKDQPLNVTIAIGLKIVEINVTVIKSLGETIGSIMIMRDVTLVKHMEDELRRHSEELEEIVYERTREVQETKEYLENLLENANDIIYTINNEGIFTYVNQKIELWGYKKEELLGKPVSSILFDEDLERYSNNIMQEMQNACELRFKNKRGEVRDVFIRTSPLREKDGLIMGFLGIATDMTERKRLEEQMLKTEKVAAIGQLAMGVAHEINNPLSGLLNCIRTLSEEGENESLRKRYIALLDKGMQRIGSIVRRLLLFTKEHEFEFTLSSVDELIKETIPLVEHRIQRENIRLRLRLNCKGKKILLPASHIQQVILNIVINAIQAMPEGGVLTIKSNEEKGILIIAISDTGVGISKENLSRIFDPFFTTKDVGEGTGLGLSLSYAIINKVGGWIEARSEKGSGSTFTLYIPRKKYI